MDSKAKLRCSKQLCIYLNGMLFESRLVYLTHSHIALDCCVECISERTSLDFMGLGVVEVPDVCHSNSI